MRKILLLLVLCSTAYLSKGQKPDLNGTYTHFKSIGVVDYRFVMKDKTGIFYVKDGDSTFIPFKLPLYYPFYELEGTNLSFQIMYEERNDHIKFELCFKNGDCLQRIMFPPYKYQD